MDFKKWLENNDAPPEPTVGFKIKTLLQRSNDLIATVKKVEEYGLGAVKMYKNSIAMLKTIQDVLVALYDFHLARQSKLNLDLTTNKLKHELMNLARLPVGSAIAGIPFFCSKLILMLLHTPEMAIVATISGLIYIMSYYTITVANDVQANGVQNKFSDRLMKIRTFLVGLLPDRMKNNFKPTMKEWKLNDQLSYLLISGA